MGVSYSASKKGFVYNFNAEMFSPGDGSASTTEIKAGIYYSIKNRQAGRVYIVGEYIMDSNDSSGIYAALRFKPNKNVRIDVGFYESIDSGGAAGSDTTTGVPLFFRLNLSL